MNATASAVRLLTLAILAFSLSLGFKFTSKCECGGGSRRLARIVGGNYASKLSHPWFAGLIKVNNTNRKPFCGGALISNQYVLTAAHCIYNKRPEEIRIALNYYDIKDYDESEILYKVSNVTFHASFDNDPKTPKSDIGLVRLEAPINITYAKKPLCMPPKQELKFRRLTAVGWGRTTRSGSQPDRLKEVSMPEDAENCKLIYGQDFLKDHVCTRDKRSKEWKDVCKGDSGGPLVGTRAGVSYIIGVVNHGTCVGTPASVFSKVAYYRDWIDENTKDSLFCETP